MDIFVPHPPPPPIPRAFGRSTETMARRPVNARALQDSGAPRADAAYGPPCFRPGLAPNGTSLRTWRAAAGKR